MFGLVALDSARYRAVGDLETKMVYRVAYSGLARYFSKQMAKPKGKKGKLLGKSSLTPPKTVLNIGGLLILPWI